MLTFLKFPQMLKFHRWSAQLAWIRRDDAAVVDLMRVRDEIIRCWKMAHRGPIDGYEALKNALSTEDAARYRSAEQRPASRE
jgi:hypothetical protein